MKSSLTTYVRWTYPRHGLEMRKTNPVGQNPLFRERFVNMILKMFIIKPQYSEKVCRNLYHKICDILLEISSQIVQITLHFAMRYRGNRSLEIHTVQRDDSVTC